MFFNQKSKKYAGWTQHVSTNFCHLKTSLDHKNEDPEWIHGPPCKACSFEENTKYSGHNLYWGKGIKVEDMAECASLCFEDGKCNFWTYNQKVSKCWMKTSDEGRSLSKTGSVSGQKACGARTHMDVWATDGNQTSSQGGLALGVGVAVGLLLLLVAVISGTLMCTKAQKRRKRNETLKLESNPVYATYEVDPDPVAEVEDTNVYYGEVYEGEERSRHTDNNPLYD